MTGVLASVAYSMPATPLTERPNSIKAFLIETMWLIELKTTPIADLSAPACEPLETLNAFSSPSKTSSILPETEMERSAQGARSPKSQTLLPKDGDGEEFTKTKPVG